MTQSAPYSQRSFDSIPAERPHTPLLDGIDSPAQLDQLSLSDLIQLVDELRAYMLYSAGQSGGHFGANLGVVELTVALHRVFDAPNDQLVWDVGHQAYAHKVLTGRRDRLPSIRSQDGLTAFPERHESEYDSFGVGHSSTSISAGLGMSLALRHLHKPHKVACVIGDGAMTGGMAFEAMNDAVQQNADLLVILNDNDMSISQATGGFSKHLALLWQRGLAVDIDKRGKPILTKRSVASDDRRIRHYVQMTNDALSDLTSSLPKKISEKINQQLAKGVLPTASQLESLPEKIAVKIIENMFPHNLFMAIGFAYFGPFDGHNLPELLRVLERVKPLKGPVLVHVHTVKGKGFVPAEADPVGYHAIGKLPSTILPVNPEHSDSQPAKATSQHPVKKYAQVFGEFLCDTAAVDKRLLAITPAMEEGSGMTQFARSYPEQFFDVAIAEQHAVTLAGGMATQGVKPIVAIYSTFLQRGYDQLIHDIALQNLDVLFAIDRAGLVGEDGATHAGVFDYAYMRCIPNMVIAAPKDENECYQLLNTCYHYHGVAAVRYPRGVGMGVAISKPAQCHEIGKAVIEAEYGVSHAANERTAYQHIDHDKATDTTTTTDTIADTAHSDVAKTEQAAAVSLALLAFGSMVASAQQAGEQLAVQTGCRVTVVNMRWIKPLDSSLIDELIATGVTHMATLEEHVCMAGAGSAVNEYLLTTPYTGRICNIGIPDRFIEHGSHAQQLAACGLDVAGVLEQLTAFIN